MFVDKVEVQIEAGNGGDGKLSFRHEKYVANGGPDGGDGGNGGDVVLVASSNQNTLAAFRYKKLIKAQDGQPGGKTRKHGRSAPPLLVQVPVGTVVTSQDGEILADLTSDGQSAVIAKGGLGGFGNAHFTSSVRQAPQIAEKGERGEQRLALLELKMIADVGIVGLPNAGKSTLLATISNAKPEIANYPFTTLTPNLGVVDVGDEALLFADIPGLIEGASQGKGLGDEFLRHVERTSVLLHLIDVYNDDLPTAYTTIQKELANYDVDLSKRPQVVALTKIEGLDDDIISDRIAELKKVVPARTTFMAISAQSKSGVRELLFKVQKVVQRERIKRAKKVKPEDSLPVFRLDEEDSWHVNREGKRFIVSGRKIERFAGRTDFDNAAGVTRLRDIMRKMGIMQELERQGIEPGQAIIVSGYRLTY